MPSKSKTRSIRISDSAWEKLGAIATNQGRSANSLAAHVLSVYAEQNTPSKTRV